jgi:hypothetical protein
MEAHFSAQSYRHLYGGQMLPQTKFCMGSMVDGSFIVLTVKAAWGVPSHRRPGTHFNLCHSFMVSTPRRLPAGLSQRTWKYFDGVPHNTFVHEGRFVVQLHQKWLTSVTYKIRALDPADQETQHRMVHDFLLRRFVNAYSGWGL